MAVEVFDYQGCLKLRREGDTGEAASATLQSMQALITLLAQKQKQEQEGEAQKEGCTNTTDATIYEFKKLISALGGSGHARFRRAPGGSPASPPSHAQGLNLPQLQDKVRQSTSLHDAMQPARSSDIDAHISQHNSSCSPCNNEEKVGGCACNTNTHHANTHTKPLFEDQSPHVSHVYGHARCRDVAATQKVCHQAPAIRLPAVPQAQQNMLPQLRLPHTSQIVARSCIEVDQDTFVPTTMTNSSFVSSVSMEGGGTVSNGKPLFSSGRPPLPPKKRKAPEEIEERKRSCHKSGQCHCAAKRRKSRSGTILRVSAIGLKNTDIPADGFSWCKYEEKPIKGCLQSRVYYKCTSVRGCPAKKHVQRALDDPNMLIVTYGREHRHPQIHKVMTSE